MSLNNYFLCYGTGTEGEVIALREFYFILLLIDLYYYKIFSNIMIFSDPKLFLFNHYFQEITAYY